MNWKYAKGCCASVLPVSLGALTFIIGVFGTTLLSISRAQEAGSQVDAERVRSHVARLASDAFEGRGPGTRGEALTTEYITEEFRKYGLKPIGPRNDYLQPVPLVRIKTSTNSTLAILKNNDALALACEEDFSGNCQTQSSLEEFDCEAVFVGHGITAPEFGWDDYKATDVRGKAVVLFTNEPPSEDPAFFGGKALTYYGRWTYKYEEAARRGAKACLIIHTNGTAGYPYSVVRPLDGAQLKRKPGEPALAFAGWLSSQAGEKMLKLAGLGLDNALKAADTKGFKPIPLGLRLKGQITSTVESILSNNVAGMLEGSDPQLKGEAVVFTAHWDHLGVGRAVLGDAIYNGAADNATGCALLMEIARVWSRRTVRPSRSAVFLAVTAEEKGLLGSKYYASSPLLPLTKTALNLNFDMIYPMGKPQSIVLTGAERTTAWPLVRQASDKAGLAIEADQRAHLGVFYRSDHFSMAKAGVPAFSVAQGMRIKGKTEAEARKTLQSFNDTAYHTPQDELRPDWDFSGFPILGDFAIDLATLVANSSELPSWNKGEEFHPDKVRNKKQ